MQKKKFDFSVFSGVTIPIAIVLGGILIIWGINALLTTEKSYKDLVLELQNKTFGNRWVAAFELSKYINASAIPEEEKPWLIENLASIYGESIDGKTRNFIIIALASLKDPRVLPVLEKALQDPESEVRFHALIGLGNFPPEKIVPSFPWAKVQHFLEEQDPALKQVALYTLTTHHIREAIPKMQLLLMAPEREVRYAAATSLLIFQDPSALDVIKEFFVITSKANLTPSEFSKIEQYQFNALTALQKSQWSVLRPEIENLAQRSDSLTVKVKAKEVLGQTKNSH